jgi:hypothetical protein
LNPLAVTVSRKSTSCGSAGCTGRTRPPLVGVWSGPRSRWCTSCGSAPAMNLDGADARHLVGASRREEMPLRPLDGGASTQWWVRTPARGSRWCLGRAPFARAHRPTELLGCSAAREWERRERMRLGFARGPSSVVLFSRKLHTAVGLRWMAHDHRTEFQPRPRLRSGARDTLSVSGPVDRFPSRAAWQPGMGSAV